ncbi:amidase [Leptobacterium flavescens]|uniref:Amidase n=1 Tax=Leptobacterium flavescens TaxID=472055 RepID=A0A6P0UJ16_9FLAO|nr:amidase family protein [Leptobacterium flavescens]NER11918.1 amidase [Leptobacterium flavescens]
MNTSHFKYIFFSLIIGLSSCKKTEEAVIIDLNELTVNSIHRAFENGDYNSEQLVNAYLKRVESYNPQLNALTVINPEALETARLLDKEYKETGVLRPLHGIPLIVKDNFNTKGLPTTAGALALKDFIPEEDAFMVARLLEAGAIILAKSNMAEWAFSPMHSESSTAGTTRNPYNLAHVPAGSSGGTGAAVAANLGTIGLGTDTGNSIRGPSSHNALVGFRSTLGLTSRSGVVPLYLRNDVAGPMCRTVEDAVKMLELIATYDPKDPVTANSKGKIPENYSQFLQKDGLKGARIGVLRTLSENDPDPEISKLFENAISDMRELGAQLIDSVEIPDFDNLRQNQWCNDFRKDIEAYLAEYVKNDTIRTLEDIVRIGSTSEYAVDGLNFFLENSGRSQNPEIECLDPYSDERRIAFREAIEKKMDELELDAIIYPSWNHKPAKIETFAEGYKGDNSQIISPHTGQPAFTVPMGFTSGNLPAGLQFLGRMYDEPTLIKLTYSYEQGTRHRHPPFTEELTQGK